MFIITKTTSKYLWVKLRKEKLSVTKWLSGEEHLLRNHVDIFECQCPHNKLGLPSMLVTQVSLCRETGALMLAELEHLCVLWVGTEWQNGSLGLRVRPYSKSIDRNKKGEVQILFWFSWHTQICAPTYMCAYSHTKTWIDF